jgi:hypothetical protein
LAEKSGAGGAGWRVRKQVRGSQAVLDIEQV